MKHALPHQMGRIFPEEIGGRAAERPVNIFSARSPVNGQAEIRECEPDDLPLVAGLFQRILRHGEKCNVPRLASYLKELFFEHPWRDPDLASLVSTSPDGAVNGFIGVLPVRMVYRNAPVRAALASSLMVDKSGNDSLIGVRLLRRFLEGPQDLSVTDTANQLSRRLWECLGGSLSAQYSMEWFRILRPAEGALALALEHWPMAAPLRVITRLIDSLWVTAKRRPFSIEANDPSIRHVRFDTDEAIEFIPSLAADYELRPSWRREELPWFLRHAQCKERHGPLIARRVVARNGTTVGCYLYYGRPGDVAFVLQILCKRQYADVVIKALLADAYGLGCTVVRGQSQPEMLAALLQNRCIYRRGPAVMAQARNAELSTSIQTGSAWITGLAGESWSRLIGGQFA
jgi:hypothetical protein